MNELQLEQHLSSLPLGAFRYYETIGSTNNEALAWASQGAPDFSLILADEQTSGRGRMDRKWFTPPYSALAMSLILRPTTIERAHPARTTGLLALSLAESLLKLGLVPQIKWPNDVLLTDRKVAGILVESTWMSMELDAGSMQYRCIKPAITIRATEGSNTRIHSTGRCNSRCSQNRRTSRSAPG